MSRAAAAAAAPQKPGRFSFDSICLSMVSCNTMIKTLTSDDDDDGAAKLAAFRRFCGSINYLDRPAGRRE